jgi:hypothetical protein
MEEVLTTRDLPSGEDWAPARSSGMRSLVR